MSFDLAIRAEGLSKRYRIGVEERRHDTLVGGLMATLRRPIENLRRLSSLARFGSTHAEEEGVLWALRDVTFDVGSGEVVGLIGRNGAGKSTLLKILTRITEPTAGRATIHGSVSSLLEVGTGFHPELTGRDNVYLNGAVLGMSRREIARKFDEIVEFSGVERFIDTPVKRYSTGMKVRLAFSVAAHLEPDILLVDEVLSVGDAEFQRKCLGKMDEVTDQGRTVVFVSHNLSAITRLCSRALLLEGGRVVMDGPAPKVVGKYLNAGVSGTAEREWPDAGRAPGGEVARLQAVRIRRDDGIISDTIDCRTGFQIEMEYEILKPGYPLWLNFTVQNNEEGVNAFSVFDLDEEWRGRRRPVGHYRTCARVPGDLLGDGMFTVDVSVALRDVGTVQFHERGAVAFHIIDRLDGSTARGDWGAHIRGAVRPKLRWTTEVLSSGEAQPPLHAEVPRL